MILAHYKSGNQAWLTMALFLSQIFDKDCLHLRQSRAKDGSRINKQLVHGDNGSPGFPIEVLGDTCFRTSLPPNVLFLTTKSAVTILQGGDPLHSCRWHYVVMAFVWSDALNASKSSLSNIMVRLIHSTVYPGINAENWRHLIRLVYIPLTPASTLR